MIKLEYVPSGLNKITDWYGGPPAHMVSSSGKAKVVADADWYKENMAYATLPFPLRLSWNLLQAVGRLAVHKKVAETLVDALQEILDYAGHAFLVKYDLDVTGGLYAPRMQRGAKVLSTHSWGIAIDYCPALGPFGEKSRMPHFIYDAFDKRGFANLSAHDGMHFQGCRGY